MTAPRKSQGLLQAEGKESIQQQQVQRGEGEKSTKGSREGVPQWLRQVKDPALARLWPRFNPRPKNFHMPWVRQEEKKKKKNQEPGRKQVRALGLELGSQPRLENYKDGKCRWR